MTTEREWGVMPRDGTDADVRWFEVDPCYVFHSVNAWEAGSKVICDVCRISEIWRKAGDMIGGDGAQTLHRWIFDLETGKVKEETLDDRAMDFPLIADARVVLKNRHAYTLQFSNVNGSHVSRAISNSIRSRERVSYTSTGLDWYQASRFSWRLQERIPVAKRVGCSASCMRRAGTRANS